MQGSAFNGGKEFVGCRALQIPAQSDTAQVGIDQHGTVSVVPGETQQSGLSGAIVLKLPTEARDIGAGARCNPIEDVAYCGESRFDAGALRMNTSRHHAANARHEIDGRRDSDDASGCSNDVHNVVGAAAGTNGIPVGIECSYRNGNSRLQSEFLCPMRR